MVLSIKSLLYIDGLILLGMLFFRWALAARMKRLIDARVFALMLLIPPMLLFVPRVEYAYAALIVAAMLARTRPELCAGYLLMLPMIPELGLEYRLGDIYLMRLSATSALAVGALLGLLWTSRTHKLQARKYDIAMAGLVILLTVLNARDLNLNGYLRQFADNFLSIGVPYIMVSRCIGSEKDAGIVLSRFYLAGALCALIAIFEATRHWAIYDSIPSRLDVPMLGIAVMNVRAGFLRAGGPFLNSTAFAFFLAVLPAGLWAIRSYFHAIGYRAVTVLLLVGLLATQSRGAWLACAAGYCALWAYRGLKVRTAGAIVGAVSLYALASFILPEQGRLAESLGRVGAAADTSQYRRQLLDAGLQQIRAHPLLGQSGADLRINMAELIQGQGLLDFVNTHLFIALSGGLVGFAVWVMIWGVPFSAGWRRGAPVGTAPASQLQLIPATMLVVSMVALTFTSTANRGLVWPVIALGLTGPFLALARRKRASGLVVSPDNLHSRDGASRPVDMNDRIAMPSSV